MKKIHSHTFFLMLAVVITLLVGSVYAYTRHAIGASVVSARAARSLLQTEESNKNHSQEIIQTYQSTSADWNRLTGFFIPADQVVKFIEALESMGPQTGSIVTLSNITADNLDQAEPGTLGSVRVHVDGHGSWSSVMRLLGLAEILPYKISLDHLRLDISLLGSEKNQKREWGISFDVQAALIASSSPSK